MTASKGMLSLGYHWRHPRIVFAPDVPGNRKVKECLDCTKLIESSKLRCASCCLEAANVRENERKRCKRMKLSFVQS